MQDLNTNALDAHLTTEPSWRDTDDRQPVEEVTVADQIARAWMREIDKTAASAIRHYRDTDGYDSDPIDYTVEAIDKLIEVYLPRRVELIRAAQKGGAA